MWESCWACTKSGREFPAFLFPEQWKPRRQEYAEGRLKFTDKTWSDILRKMERFFPGMGVCGWFVYEKSGGMVDKLSLKRTYEETFAQGSKVLLLHDDQDEEAFYMLWKGKMTRMNGYYIYYERNRICGLYRRRNGAMAGRKPAVSA